LNQSEKSVVLYGGTERQKRSDGKEVMNWRTLEKTTL